jgi:hypothetical protein
MNWNTKQLTHNSVTNSAPALMLMAGLLTSCAESNRSPNKNPNPLQAIHVLATTVGLPTGSKVAAMAHYQVLDDQCIEVDHSTAIGGTRPGIIKQEPLRVTATGDRSFEATAFDDFYLPTKVNKEQEPCVYRLSSISFTFIVRGLNRTTFIGRQSLDLGNSESSSCDLSNTHLTAAMCISSDTHRNHNNSFIVTTKRN